MNINNIRIYFQNMDKNNTIFYFQNINKTILNFICKVWKKKTILDFTSKIIKKNSFYKILFSKYKEKHYKILLPKT